MSFGLLLANPNERTTRAPVNPLDKSTIVSIYPRRVYDTKVTIQPGVFELAPGSYEKPSILIVGPSSWWRRIDFEQPLLEIPIPSITIADSVVRDYCNGIPECDMAEQMPGLFYLPSFKYSNKETLEPNINETVEWIKKEHKPSLDKANQRQKNWFQALVKRGDIDWARTNGNPLAISDMTRMAARELGINREWLRDFQTVELIRCVACGALRDPRFPVCRECKAIADPEAAKKLNLTFAQ